MSPLSSAFCAIGQPQESSRESPLATFSSGSKSGDKSPHSKRSLDLGPVRHQSPNHTQVPLAACRPVLGQAVTRADKQPVAPANRRLTEPWRPPASGVFRACPTAHYRRRQGSPRTPCPILHRLRPPLPRQELATLSPREFPSQRSQNGGAITSSGCPASPRTACHTLLRVTCLGWRLAYMAARHLTHIHRLPKKPL